MPNNKTSKCFKFRRSFSLTSSLAILSIAALSPSLMAAETDIPDIHSKDAPKPLSLDENSQSIQNIPNTYITAMRIASTSHQYPINKIEADEYAQATHISEALTAAPSVWISRGNGQENLTAIRGPVFVGAGACGPFVMSEDGISLRAANFCNVNQLIDANYIQADGIEVLRGPASEAFGANAIHGVINIISPQFLPSVVNDSSTKLSFIDSSHGFNRYMADYRSNNFIAQAMFDDDEGYKKESGYKQSKLRLKHAIELSQDWSLVQNFNAMDLDQDTAGYQEGKDAYKDDDLKKSSDKQGFRKATSYRYAGTFEYSPRDNATLALTPYIRSNDMEFAMHWLPGEITEENGHDSIGLQSIYTRTYDDWQVNTGFDVDYTQGYLRQFNAGEAQFGNKIPAGDHYDYDVNAVSAAVFLHAQYSITPSLMFTAGTRLDYLHFDYENNLSDGIACNPAPNLPSICRYFRPESSTDSFSDLSPRTSIIWEFSPQHFASINLSQTYRSPQATELYRLEDGQERSNIDSVKANNAELVLNGFAYGLSYNFSAYYMKKSNVIIKSNSRQNVDGQKTRHQGLELSLQGWLIDDKLEFIGSYAYGKHQYDSNPWVLFATGENIKGNIMDTAPRHLGSASLNWHVFNQSKVGLELVYIDNYYLNPENTKSYDGHTLTNLTLSQQLPWSIDVSATVKNVFDIDYADRADLTTFSKDYRYFIGEPRSYQISIAKTF